MNKLIVVLSIFLVLFGCSQKNSSESVYINDNKYTTVSLEEFATEVKVSRIRTDILLDNISDVICVGEDAFLLSKNEKVYYMKDDSIVSVLEAQGHGPEEYEQIKSISYSRKDSILCIYSSASFEMLCYKVPEFKFYKKIEMQIRIDNMRITADDKIIAICTDNTSTKPYGVYSISITDDSISKLFGLNYVIDPFRSWRGSTFHMGHLLISRYGLLS